MWWEKAKSFVLFGVCLECLFYIELTKSVSQVEHVLIDRLMHFMTVDLEDAKVDSYSTLVVMIILSWKLTKALQYDSSVDDNLCPGWYLLWTTYSII